MNALESPHALPGDRNGHGTPAQHMASEVLALRAGHIDHETRIVAVERRRDFVPAALVVIAVLAALTLGALLGLVHYARELVQHLPR